MYHTSQVEIKEGSIKKYGNTMFNDCLFFSDKIYTMSAKKSGIYVYEADFNCIDVSMLDDEETVAEIMRFLDCDEDTAYGLLDGTLDIYNAGIEGDSDYLADMSYWLQAKRGECAKKMGYDGCQDRDEQGTVYIVPMCGRESELKFVKKIS